MVVSTKALTFGARKHPVNLKTFNVKQTLNQKLFRKCLLFKNELIFKVNNKRQEIFKISRSYSFARQKPLPFFIGAIGG